MDNKMKRHIKLIAVELIFLVAVLFVVWFLYPRADFELEGNSVCFGSINANVIIMSENPDFSNSRYLDIESGKNISFNLGPGKYYWKASNNYIESLEKEFKIESEVGMKINRIENESELVNAGNVKINVTRGDGGIMVGHIILEPEESEEIEDKNETYTGRQE